MTDPAPEKFNFFFFGKRLAQLVAIAVAGFILQPHGAQSCALEYSTLR
jgi:hypothetical protein